MRQPYTRLNLVHVFVFISLFCLTNNAFGQYFGQNKMRYKTLDFKVKETPHFDFYTYLQNDSLLNRFAQESELWYELHQQVFRDTFLRKNPLILYNNHPDFQQTTAIGGEISIGTGGVTEALKNRVVMPIMQINEQTRHVLGHELVHAFQYHSLIEGDSTRLENIGNLPLWMVEGMAEYLSIGKKDAFTAMWMRDAYLNKDIPSLKDLTESNKYFPYRYGQAFWAYIGSTYGDTVIVPFFKNTAKYGYQAAIKYTFGYDEQTLSNLWRTSIENAYEPLLTDTAQTPKGHLIIDNKNGGNMNVSPTISPNGKYVAFLSERDLFSIDLFLADAQTGKIIRKLSSRQSNTHIDEFSYIESAGSFSNDSKKFAFSVFSGGVTKLLIVDVEKGKTLSMEAMGDVGEFANITWSPNGELIAFSGLKNGYSDLYLYNLKTKEVTQLTRDKYSDYHPSFSRGGKKIVFSTDRLSFESNHKGVDIPLGLAVIDLQTKAIQPIPIFPGANNLNPQFSSDDSQIYFLSNRDGFRNMYRYTLSSQKIEQLTNYFTGISGITEYSPALSISANDDILYSYYRAQKYTIYNAKPSDFTPKEVSSTAVNFDAALLPPPQSLGVNIINTNLSNYNLFQRIDTSKINPIPYKPKFQLDYLQGSGVGVAVGSRYGAGLSSGIQGIFSDILGRNQLFAGLAINGEVYDFGGQFAYINQKSRINWGASISHLPFMSGLLSYGTREIDGVNYLTENTDIIRTFQDQIDAFAAYPFSRVARFELGAALAHYSYRVDRYSNYYDPETYIYMGSDKRKISNEEASQTYGGSFDSFTLQQLNAAFVGDNSYFGVAAPLSGYRYRIAAEKYFGDFNFMAYTADLRKYQRFKPITLAARAYTYMRVGDGEDRLYPLYIGYPFLVRGFESASFYENNNNFRQGYNLNQLMGSRIAVVNLEARLPFTGPEKLAAIKSGILFSDLNVFFDMGLAWNGGDKIAFKTQPDKIDEITNPDGSIEPVYERVPAMSAGVSLRVNIFGYFVLELYYAIPFNRKDISFGTFGLNFAPGW